MTLSQSEVRALLLLIRRSGLAMRDAVRLPASALEAYRLTGRRAKTGNGEPCCPRKPVTDALARSDQPERSH